MAVRNIYLKIEEVLDYSPAEPSGHAAANFRRDCMRNPGHEDGTIPLPEVEARALNALIYREYLDPGYLIPKPDKLVLADVNEPIFPHRVPGTVIYAHPGDDLHIRVLNGDSMPHSLHVNGLRYGIDSDGSWPLGTQSTDGRRSDEICPGQFWLYHFSVTEETAGNAYPFYDHWRHIGASVNRGLFGGIVVLPKDCDRPREMELPPMVAGFLKNKSGEQARDHNDDLAGAAPVAAHEPHSGRGEQGDHGGHSHAEEVDNELRAQLAFLEEWSQLDYAHPKPDPEETLHVPLFFHQMISEDSKGLRSFCFNGRSFVGNTPTIVAHSGQKIRWYVFNLDLDTGWHNLHLHAQRWQFAQETIDSRSIGPAESFVVETTAPPVILLPGEIEAAQEAHCRLKGAEPYRLRGDFLFSCQGEAHMRQGLAGLVRSRQTVWLTPDQAKKIAAESGLPLDHGGNACPSVDDDRCEALSCGKWELVSGATEVCMMHAVLLPNTERVLLFGYGDTRDDLSRVWDYSTPAGSFVVPPNQPFDVTVPVHDRPLANIWSAEHAFINDAQGTVLVHGGFTPRQSFLFSPVSLQWSRVAPTAEERFYSSTLTLADGRLMTLYGSGSKSIEVYDPGAGTWGAPIAMPASMAHHQYYPWTYVLPSGKLFIAGPHVPTQRFDWNPVVANVESFPTINGNRSTGGERGTSVLLPLRPPAYVPRVLIAGGDPAAAQQTAEIIDLSAATPVWSSLPNLNRARMHQVNTVLLPDGRVMLAGGIDTADGGPVEIFDPRNPAAGWELCATMSIPRGYHSAAILLADGSVLMGGDRPGAWKSGETTAHERYFPWYYSLARPVITGAPASIAYGASFDVKTPSPATIAEVALLRPGAVTHGWNQSQRYIECRIVGGTATAVSVQAPPNGNIAPPGHYLLFVLTGGRVPSVGRWIRLS